MELDLRILLTLETGIHLARCLDSIRTQLTGAGR